MHMPYALHLYIRRSYALAHANTYSNDDIAVAYVPLPLCTVPIVFRLKHK